MNVKTINWFVKLFIIFLVIQSPIVFSAEGKNADLKKVYSNMVSSGTAWMNSNRLNGAFHNDGIWMYDKARGTWGLEWPKFSECSPIFGAGQMIGAKVNGEICVAGTQHSQTEFQPGVILSSGIASDPNNPEYRIYELRKNGVGDWNNWPVDQGAPVDIDGNPLLLGSQTIFSVWNDLGDHYLYGTQPLGVELRQLAWAYHGSDELEDIIFISWQFVNKSDNIWEDTYFSIWLDPDIGFAEDDFVGCDSTLSLGYCYNAYDYDQNYGIAPPAGGVDFLHGPIVNSPGDSVQFVDGTVLIDKKMLKMTAFVYYNNDDSNQGNPQTGGDIWNYLRGFWRDGSPITEGGTGIDPGNLQTAFMFTGDPVSGTGWNDSNEADRRFLMTTGPFTMPPWEDINENGVTDFGEPGVQYIVAAVIAARGTDYLNSITKLKDVDNTAQQIYDNQFEGYTSKFCGPAEEALHIDGASNGRVRTQIVDKDLVSGHTYQVQFGISDSITYWEVFNNTSQQIVTEKQWIQSGFNNQTNEIAVFEDPCIVDGIQIGVSDTERGISSWGIDGSSWFMPGYMFPGDDNLVDIELRFAGCNECTGSTAEELAEQSKNQNPQRWSKAVEYQRINYNYEVQTQLADVPFTVYDLETQQQIKVAIREDSTYSTPNFLWDLGWNGSSYSESFGGREYIYIINEEYDEEYSSYLDGSLHGVFDNMYTIRPEYQIDSTLSYLQNESDMYISCNKSNGIYDVYMFTWDIPTNIQSVNINPKTFSVYPAYPNPFNPSTKIRYNLPKRSKVTITIYNINGQVVDRLVNQQQEPGFYSVNWDARNFSSGVYIYRIKADGFSAVKKCVMMK